jgi:hypothetical protein
VLVDNLELNAYCVRDDTDGDGGPPSQKQQRPGVLRDIYVPVTAGVPIRITLACRYSPDADPRPRMLVRANSDVGLTGDLEVVAPSGSGWTTLTTSFTPTADGVVQVWREMRSLEAGAFAAWDAAEISE